MAPPYNHRVKIKILKLYSNHPFIWYYAHPSSITLVTQRSCPKVDGFCLRCVMPRHPWKRCDVEGFLLLFTEIMMFVLTVSSLLGLLSVIIIYFLTIYLLLTYWFTIPYYSKIFYVWHVLTYIRYLFFPLLVTSKFFYPSAKVIFHWQPVTSCSQVV